MKTFGSSLKEIRHAKAMTQEEFAQLLGTTKQVISRYENNQRIPKITVVKEYAQILEVPLARLLGHEERTPPFNHPRFKPAMVMKPLLERIPSQEQISKENTTKQYIETPSNIHCDFVLRCQDDSMIDFGIENGDLLYIRSQADVDHGEIAAVCINGKGTLQKIYKYEDKLMLQPGNKDCPPLVFMFDEIDSIFILGKLVATTHWF